MRAAWLQKSGDLYETVVEGIGRKRINGEQAIKGNGIYIWVILKPFTETPRLLLHRGDQRACLSRNETLN